jgi:hypothetical protein
VTPESLNAQISWGTDDPAGCLSIAAAGSWQIQTYDPKRLLDPGNDWTPLVDWLKPGGFCRVMFNNEVVRHGFIDEITFDLATLTGSIRASDGISLLVKAKVPEGLMHAPDAPLTLRARARWILQKAAVTYIRVEDDPAGEVDPVVGLPLDQEASAWQQINACALDALHACWLDRQGVLRFRYFGNPYASGINIGFAPDPLYAIPIDTLESKVSLEGIYNHVRAANDIWVNPGYGDAKNQEAIDVYGDLLYTRDRGNPDAGDWATLVMQDRGQSEARFGIGTMRFQRAEDLIAVLDLGMVYNVNLNASAPDAESAPVSEIVTVLGGKIEANTESGWSGGLVTYKPSQPLVRPHKPVYMARYDVTKNRQLYVIKGNTGGGETPSPFDLRLRNNDDPPGSKTTRLLFDCDPIDWTGITKIIRVLFCTFSPPHDHAAGERVNDLRHFHMCEITGAWDENAVWPGPAIAEEYYGDIEPHIGWEQEQVQSIFSRWYRGETVQHGIAMQPWHVDPQSLQDAWGDEEHVQVNNRTVDSRPYFLIYYER